MDHIPPVLALLKNFREIILLKTTHLDHVLVKSSHFTDDTSVMNFGKNLQYDFPKMRGGVKGGLEFFRKFICFGGGRLPLERRKYGCQLRATEHNVVLRAKVANEVFAFHLLGKTHPNKYFSILSFPVVGCLDQLAF